MASDAAAWTSPNAEGSAHFDTSIAGLKRRVAVWARANRIPAPPEILDAVFAKLQAPGSPFELEEGHVLTDAGSTGAPHLSGPRAEGQRYRYFKNGEQRLHDIYGKQCNGGYRERTFVVYAGPDAKGGVERYTFGETYALAGNLAA